MANEDTLYAQIKPRLIDFLKVAGLPFWEPALGTCPHCNEQCAVYDDHWSCPSCKAHGDIVDYVMELEHFVNRAAAIKRICRALQIKITTLDVISGDELLDTQFEPTQMVIDGFLGQGTYILAGAPKIGKSWLVLWLGHQVSCGANVWEFPSRKCGVLYISLEDTRQRIQNRLAKVSGGETGNIWFATEAELLGKGLEEQISGFLTENPTVQLVIVDTLQKVRLPGSNQYSYAGDYEVITRLKALADRFGITTLLVHHTRKEGADDPFSMISGTTGLSGGVDGSMVLIKDDRDDNRAELFVTGRDIRDMHMRLIFDEYTHAWHFLGYVGNERIERRDKLLNEINDFLSEVGVFHGTASDLMTKLSARTDNLEIKSANALTRLLNPQKNYLQHEFGIQYSYQRSGKERTLNLTKASDDSDGNDDT